MRKANSNVKAYKVLLKAISSLRKAIDSFEIVENILDIAINENSDEVKVVKKKKKAKK